MKKHNKFIPVALLAGLCVLAVSMCNEECNAEGEEHISSTTKKSYSKDGDKETKTIERTKSTKEKKDSKSNRHGRRNYKSPEKNTSCKTGNCKK